MSAGRPNSLQYLVADRPKKRVLIEVWASYIHTYIVLIVTNHLTDKPTFTEVLLETDAAKNPLSSHLSADMLHHDPSRVCSITATAPSLRM